METLAVIFWILLILVFYSYLGYGIVLFILIKLKRLFFGKQDKYANVDYEPEVTLFVAAYNEKDYLDRKVKNSYELNYPQEKVRQIWVTDGSDDGTPELLRKYEGVEVYHQDARNGKIAAMNRGMKYVQSPIVIFSDGNTLLGKDSIREIVNLFKNPNVGCVSGKSASSLKKRILPVAPVKASTGNMNLP